MVHLFGSLTNKERHPAHSGFSFALVFTSVTRAHSHLQRPGSWPENEVQQFVDAEWRDRCRYGTEERTDEDSVDARALVGQARMLKMVRSWYPHGICKHGQPPWRHT
jgi:hypothetical protein